MNGKRRLPVLLAGLILGLASACGSGIATQTPQVDLEAVSTAAVQTFVARLTLTAGQTAVAQLTQIAITNPVVTPPTPASLIETPAPASLTPTAARIPASATPTVRPCNQAELVTNITVEDGAQFDAGTPFIKIWRLKNTGSCAWNNKYSFGFVSGDRMDGPNSQALTRTVNPGQTIDIAVNLLAPDTGGVYAGSWQLVDDSGAGVVNTSETDALFWARIIVNQNTRVVYEFVSILCAADWESSLAGKLSCPASAYDTTNGFVTVESGRMLENGAIASKPVVITFPSLGSDGQIWGTYPAFKVKTGDRFKTAVGCLYGSSSCNVNFSLKYSADGGSIQNLGTWSEVYSDHYRPLDIDLSPLAGRSVQFILAVSNNGSSADDWAFWLMPAIYR